MKWLLFFISIILLNSSVFGQQVGSGVTDGIDRVNNDLLTSWMNDIRPSGTDLSAVEGSPYFLDDWTYGKVVSIKGERFADVNLKLNLFQKELMVQPLNSKDSFLMDDSKLLQFDFIQSDSTYSFVRVNQLDGSKPKPYLDFYQLLVSGKMNLLYQPIVEIRQPPKNTMATAGGRGAGIYSREDNFYLYNGVSLEKVKKSKKPLLKALGRYQKEVDRFMSKYNLKPGKPEDLIQIVRYYNTLN
ncbi:MAG: hypothetical protein ABJH98_19470 [Reichenbachiella sp.]|uniref:hypothetical protein n=1 Tax=Reichenbachiella sp. TaxID=2184521 RepID=UPI0032986AE5